MNYYMHTINGRPAVYRGGQICYAIIRANVLVGSLKKITQQQAASVKWRQEQGYRNRFEYGHVLVKTP